MKKSSLVLSALAFVFSSTLAHAWWDNKNDWGVRDGVGSYSTYNVDKVSGNLVASWSGVVRDAGSYAVILYPSAVEGWNTGDGAPSTNFYVGLNSSGSYAGCYFVPTMANNWDSGDIWNMSLDIWCHKTSTDTKQSDEVMLWVKWKGMAPIGEPSETLSGGRSLWYGWTGWSVRTVKDENESGSIDVRQLCIDAGVPTERKITGIHAGAEICTGSASLKLSGYSTWWKNNSSSASHNGS